MPLLAAGQAYPSKPIRLVVPYPPGGGLDLFARPLAQKVTELVGQPVVVENKPGASGVVGAAYVAQQPADGYTLLLAPAAQYLQPFVSKNVPFDNAKDFTPVISAVNYHNVIVVHPELPIRPSGILSTTRNPIPASSPTSPRGRTARSTSRGC